MPSFRLPLLLLLWRCSQSVAQLMNVTVDDQDPRIHYYPNRPSWGEIHESADANGTHMLTTTPGAYAIINFTFVTFYFMSPRWPYPVSTGLQLDDQPPVTLELQDLSVPLASDDSPATKSSGIVYQIPGTTSAEHTLRVFIPSGGQQAIIDMFMFEVEDSSSTTTSTSQSTSVNVLTTTASSTSASPIDRSSQGATRPTSAPTLSSTTAVAATFTQPTGTDQDLDAVPKKKSQGWKIGVAVGICVLGLLLLVIFGYLCIRRTNGRRPRNNGQRANFTIDPSDSNIWGDVAPPVTATHEGTNGFQYKAVPVAEASINPATTVPAFSNALYDDASHAASEHTPLYNTPTQKGDVLEGTSSIDGSDAVVGPSTSSGASEYSERREIPRLNLDEARQSGTSWDSGYPQPLKFIPIG